MEKSKRFLSKIGEKKYDPLRVWCCVPALFEFGRLAIIQQTWGRYCDKLLFFIGDNTQKEIEVVNVTQKLANGSDYTLNNVVKLKLERTGSDGHGDTYEKMWKMRQLSLHQDREHYQSFCLQLPSRVKGKV